MGRAADIVMKVVLSCCVGSSIVGGAVWLKVMKQEKEKRDALQKR